MLLYSTQFFHEMYLSLMKTEDNYILYNYPRQNSEYNFHMSTAKATKHSKHLKSKLYTNSIILEIKT